MIKLRKFSFSIDFECPRISNFPFIFQWCLYYSLTENIQKKSAGCFCCTKLLLVFIIQQMDAINYKEIDNHSFNCLKLAEHLILKYTASQAKFFSNWTVSHLTARLINAWQLNTFCEIPNAQLIVLGVAQSKRWSGACSTGAHERHGEHLPIYSDRFLLLPDWAEF